MATTLDPATVKLRNVRLSFADLFTKTASIANGPLKYRASFLIDPNTPDGKANMKALAAARKHVEMEKFGKPMEYKDPKRCCIKDGNDQCSEKTGEPYEGYADMMVISGTNDKNFPIVDADKTPLKAEDGKPYNGCYVNAVLRLYGVKDKDKGGNGLFAGISAIQFLRHGDTFGAGAVNADEVFDDETEGEEV
jgi:hypothetical protein